MEIMFGTYPGSLEGKEEYYENCTQLELFLTIGVKRDYIQFLKDDFRDAGYEYCDIREEMHALDYLIYLSKRFGVEFEELQKFGRLKKTNSFLKWYNKCDNLVEEKFTYEELDEMERKIKEDKYVSKYEIFWEGENPTIKLLVSSYDDVHSQVVREDIYNIFFITDGSHMLARKRKNRR